MKLKTKASPLQRKVGNIILGQVYTEVVHNQVGIATGYAYHVTGCDRVLIEFKHDDGIIREFWTDITRLLDHKKIAQKPDSKREFGGLTLGTIYKDKLSDQTGVMTVYTVGLTASPRCCLEFRDGNHVVRDHWCDVSRLQTKDGKDIKLKLVDGPCSDPPPSGSIK